MLKSLESALRRAAIRCGAELAYLTFGLVTSVIAFVVWLAGGIVSLTLAPVLIGGPVFVVTARALRGVADLGRLGAGLLRGQRVRGRYEHPSRDGVVALFTTTFRDPQTWRDLGWTMLHSVVGFAFGVTALSLVASALGMVTLPLWYWIPPAPPHPDFIGLWTSNTLLKALAVVPFSIPTLAITAILVRWMTAAHLRMTVALLERRGVASQATPAWNHGSPMTDLRASAQRVSGGSRPVSAQLTLSAICAAVVFVLWAATGADYFWPMWVWFGLAIPIAFNLGLRRAWDTPPGRPRALAIHATVSWILAAISVAIWVLSGGGFFWPVFELIGLAAAFALHASFRGPRQAELTGRVAELTRTRRGALDVQAAELRRIERDLHDGAQARLVALSMQLGRAEERLADRPDAAELVRSAREHATAAIGELRDLARGIAPPVLADRGLAAAVRSLADRSGAQVVVTAELEERLPPVVETAAYFVVAESLTNVAKHAPGASADVLIGQHGGWLLIEVADDGPGGVDPSGSGITGLRQRVEALDGTLVVDGPAAGGTKIKAALPCG